MKNNKGFLLAETIVTVCIIAALGTSMYLYISKTTARFEDRSNYENVVDIYKVNTLKEYLKNKNYTTISSSAITEEVLGVLNDEQNLNIKEAYLISDTEDAKNDLIEITSSQALKDYLNWISVSGESTSSRLIVWFYSDEGDGTFANLKK